MSMKTVDEALSELDQTWREIEPATPTGQLPDGVYKAEIVDVSVGYAKTSGRLQFNWQFKIIEPAEYAGQFIFKHSGLATPENLRFAKADFATVGIMLDKLSDLVDREADFLGRGVELRLKTNGEFQNVYIQKLLWTPDGTTVDDSVTEDSDLPF